MPSLADFVRRVTETVLAMHGLADDLLAGLVSSDPPLSRVKLLPCFSPQNASYHSAGKFWAFLIICVASMEAGPTLASFGWRAITVVRPQIAAMPTTTALVAMIAARNLALRPKQKCLPRLGFTLAFPSSKNFE
jgi:hypothetical protein